MPNKLKIFASMLGAGRYKDLSNLSNSKSGLVDIASIELAINESALDRVVLAKAFLDLSVESDAVARSIKSDIHARNAISRSYYCLHHLARAVTLFKDRVDASDHNGAIEQLTSILFKDKLIPIALEKELGDLVKDQKSFVKYLRRIMDYRHHADYHVYGASAMEETPIDYFMVSTKTVDDVSKLYSAIADYLRREGLSVP